jgi:aspartyl-tRNA(Asn)/glutamyl-tRNA(Gln) amidotransferase subunit A
MRPRELTIAAASRHLAGGQLSSVELCTSVLDAVDRLNERTRAYITVRDPQRLLEDARRSDARRRRGEARGPLDGIPLGLKDNLETAGLRTTAGSKLLSEWIPDRSASVVRKLDEAGALLVGKLNMHEFADGPTNDNPRFGRPLNPWDGARTCGGSSGGNAVALALDMCLGAIGTDTGGSIRTPAAFCGIAGLKPTYGLVSRTGVVPFSWSLDHVGPMARTAEDVGILLQAIAGYDEADPVSCAAPGEPSPTIGSFGGIVIGVETSYLAALMEDGVRQGFSAALDLLETLGARIEHVRLPRLEVSLAVQVAIMFPEGASVHRRILDERPMDLGEDVRRSLISGRLYGAGTYIEAQRVRAVLRRDLAALFDSVDLLAAPTVIMAPPLWGRDSFSVQGRDLDALNAFIRCTAPFNLTGNPALSVACGLTELGLPVGLQLIAPPFADGKLLNLASLFESARGPFPRPPRRLT